MQYKSKSLYAEQQNLTELPELPELPIDLTELFCSGNQLTELPELPNTLTELFCSDNHFPDTYEDESIPDYMIRYHAFQESQELQSKERIIHRCSLYFEQLMMKVWHPDRVEKWMLAGIDMEDM